MNAGVAQAEPRDQPGAFVACGGCAFSLTAVRRAFAVARLRDGGDVEVLAVASDGSEASVPHSINNTNA